MFKQIATLVTLATIATVGFYMINQQSQVPQVPNVPSVVYDTWTHWKQVHKKSYGGAAEEAHRLLIFADNFEQVKVHQQDENKTYEKSLNKFADLTAAEFKSMYLNFNVESKPVNEVVTLNAADAADTVDWVKAGKVNPVKDQGQCGSCWAFSTVGSLESAEAIFGKGLVNLSEQQLVDCSKTYGNQGCNGGLMDYGFKFVQEKGLTTTAKYPYRAVDQKCKVKTGDFKITKFTDVPKGDVATLATAVTQQPVSIAVDANNFQFYSGGVFKDCKKELDHGVTLVGYTKDFWLVRNSWGADWGESGYIRLARGDTCGLAQAASYPTL